MAIMRVGDFQFSADDMTVRRYQRVILKRLLTGKNLFFQGAGCREPDEVAESSFVVNIGPSSELSFHYDSANVPLLEVGDEIAEILSQEVEFVGVLISGGIDLEDDRLRADKSGD
ncbi:hypothetical protein [Arthrobacter glacialis]|uniref:hypothetical protein n=1 Tax=Arthrobacter glacialis TaxID=1664 RepID=UPI000CD45216|nr:hypothetical protein [Arthrobacter glacialis]POH58888.1 hypothetical protein CVS28_09270 [Arthrobacter glacialis]